ncbi:trypsin-like serine peptidase [Antrihabitans stalactiti]|uniref:Trypsin-like serine protease n=1 Tax=Antrihabitans stalactiti TaxID=2584121 RepID=A0A848KD82_9NOCA|nr:trypsin-like peptidase domain-containing protein [Antrihabitans stalactiti]NMN95696.1 trypsin-like serine protease [Antrihabitans stalactiti]
MTIVWRVASSLVAVAVVTACGPAQAEPHPTAHPGEPIPTIGVLFAGNTPIHTCTAGVLDSAAGDLVLTAAHCLAGPGLGISFAPGYDNGVSPFGVWTVEQVFVDAQWVTVQDPAHDYAILRVKRDDGAAIESVVGGGLTLAAAPTPGTALSISGYPIGLNDRPLTCNTTARVVEQDPAFSCAGFGDGTSGSPWVVGTTATGVIGGRHQGGCTGDETFSAPFGADVFALLDRAETATTGDSAPIALGDGC